MARTPAAIGYRGMGYQTEQEKMLRVARTRGQPGMQPSVATTLDQTYSIARPMFMYTPGEPPPHVRRLLDWALSPAGQHSVQLTGYIPQRPASTNFVRCSRRSSKRCIANGPVAPGRGTRP